MTTRAPHPRRDGHLTTTWLRQRSACDPQIYIVRETFGARHKITRASLRAAAELNLDLHWLSQRLLISREAKAAYRTGMDKADTAYLRAIRRAYGSPDTRIRSYGRAQADALWRAWQVERKGRR